MGRFNLDKLRLALLPLVSEPNHHQLLIILRGYTSIYNDTYWQLFRHKVGLYGSDSDRNDVHNVIDLLLKMMAETRADFTLTFRQLGDWACSSLQNGEVPRDLWALKTLSKHKLFKHWTKLYWRLIQESSISETSRKEQMHRVNPRYILRNWIAQEAIGGTERDDFGPLRRIQRVLSQPFRTHEEAELAGYADPPPPWAGSLKVSCSS